jgi:hypothetical protein
MPPLPTPNPTNYPTTAYSCGEAVTSWAALKYCCEAGGNEVILSEAFVAGDNPGEISVTGACAIRGSGEILDAGGMNRFFRLPSSTSSLEIEGLRPRNGYTFDIHGGAIKITWGTLCIKNTTFDSNTVGWPKNEQDGGAIYASGANAKICTTIFKDSQSNAKGGAIFADSTNMETSRRHPF